MGQTTYFEFNKPIGTDLVNPLVDQIPNWDIADNALHELDTRSIANATEVVALGVHAISRLNTYTKFIKWIATGNFTAGDTFTVDGNVVAASTASGDALATNAYVTGAVVLACLNADDSAMTVFVSGSSVAADSARLGGELPSYYATQADMSNAQTDIGNIQALNGTTSIASIGDGTLTGAVSSLDSDLSGKLDVSAYEITGVNPDKVVPTVGVDYTVPKDGYLYIALQDRVGASASVAIKLDNNVYVSLFNMSNPTAAYNLHSLYLRKGTIINVASLSNASCDFYPCTYA